MNFLWRSNFAGIGLLPLSLKHWLALGLGMFRRGLVGLSRRSFMGHGLLLYRQLSYNVVARPCVPIVRQLLL